MVELTKKQSECIVRQCHRSESAQQWHNSDTVESQRSHSMTQQWQYDTAVTWQWHSSDSMTHQWHGNDTVMHRLRIILSWLHDDLFFKCYRIMARDQKRCVVCKFVLKTSQEPCWRSAFISWIVHYYRYRTPNCPDLTKGLQCIGTSSKRGAQKLQMWFWDIIWPCHFVLSFSSQINKFTSS